MLWGLPTQCPGMAKSLATPLPRPKVHGHFTNENGAIACIIEFDNGSLMNIIVHDLGVA